MSKKGKAARSVNTETVCDAPVKKADIADVHMEQDLEPKFDVKECPVVNYVSSNGVIGFIFDGVPCQANIGKNMDIGKTIKVRYSENTKEGFEFE